jgi:methyl-accepting chemotaxis protein
MDFDGAIAAHSAWKAKLSAYLRNPDKSLSAATIGMDNQCALGQWLHGEGQKYSSDAEFADLQKEHANFHRAASDLVRRADLGEKVSEEASLGANSPYVKLSSHVVQLIVKVKQKAK